MKNGEALTSRYAIRDFEKLKLRETKTLEDYKLSEKIETVTLKENQVTTKVIENEVKKGKIKVIKVDLDNNEIRIPNVEFEVLDEANNVVDTLITNANGEAISKELPISQEYLLKETKTNEWYKLNEEAQTVTLKNGEIVEKVITNEKMKGQIKVIKTDKDNNKILLEGVKFDVLDEQGNVVDSMVTEKNGEAISKELPIDQEYTVIERETKKEYVLTEETQTIRLKHNEITEAAFANEKIKGYIEITKADSKTKETLKGAKFEIYNENNEIIETMETREDGKATSGLIPYGKYYLKEVDSGSVYYLLNKNIYEFEIVNNHEIVPMTVENEPVDITVDIDKEGTVEIRPGEKVDYTFSNVANNSNIYLDNFKWYDYIPTDYIRIEKMTTGTWNQDLTYSVYYKTNKSDDYILFKENLKTNEDYILDFAKVKLRKDEYITETMFDFGKVEKGFRENTSPTMQCRSFDTLKNNETFTNHTKTVGIYEGISADAEAKWTTIVHTPKEHEPILPRTGK